MSTGNYIGLCPKCGATLGFGHLPEKCTYPYRIFESMNDAFDYCREVDRPVTIVLTGKPPDTVWKLFPSGSAKQIVKNLDFMIREAEG